MRVSWLIAIAVLFCRPASAAGPVGIPITTNPVHQIPNADPGQAVANRACAKYALYMLSGISDADMPPDQLKYFCSRKADGSTCQGAVDLIKQNGKSTGGLTCSNDSGA